MITYHFVVFMMQILLAFELTNKGELGKKGEIMEEEEVGSVTLSRPDTVLQLTEVVMSVKLSQAVNFFFLTMKAMIALSFTIRNCFRVLFAP